MNEKLSEIFKRIMGGEAVSGWSARRLKHDVDIVWRITPDTAWERAEPDGEWTIIPPLNWNRNRGAGS